MTKQAVSLNGKVLGSNEVYPTPTIWLVCDGDSITWGQTEGAVKSTGAFPALIGNLIRASHPNDIVGDANFATPADSWTLSGGYYAGRGKTIVQRAPTNIDPFLSKPAPVKWLVAFAGTNGIANAGNTPATEYNNLLTYFNARIAAGWAASQIVFPTMLPRGSDAIRNTYNNLIRSNASTYGYRVADFAGNIMDLTSTLPNTTYYYDGLHPTLSGGHPLLAQVIYSAMYP